VSTLWTPSGEHPVPKKPTGETGGTNPADQVARRSEARSRPVPPPAGQGSGPPMAGAQGKIGDREPTPEEIRDAQAEMDEVREQLLHAPVELVISNHAMGLWELAALHLSQTPPQLPQAQLAIDALSSLVDGMRGRLGDAERTLADGLAQIRLAFVQIANAQRSQAGTTKP